MGGLYYKVHGLRLAQASEMQLDLKANRPHGKGKPARIHMQLDGEPWQQELPCEEAEPPLHVSILLFQTHCEILSPYIRDTAKDRPCYRDTVSNKVAVADKQ